ncbi:MAG: hypothetical protein JWP27_2848 [Flaviaesturariibacter sp.]|nr:hypothetical protein [Flaviaesturariibacter sp.]
MNGQPPYQEPDGSWDELPLPDSDKSWQAMEALLDRDKDRKPLVPPFLAGCAVAALIGVCLLAVFLWLRPGGGPAERVGQTQHNAELQPGRTSTPGQPANGVTTTPYRIESSLSRETGTATSRKAGNKMETSLTLTSNDVHRLRTEVASRGHIQKPSIVNRHTGSATTQNQPPIETDGKRTASQGTAVVTAPVAVETREQAPALAMPSGTDTTVASTLPKTSTGQVAPPPVDKMQGDSSAAQKAAPKKRVLFSAGVGLQQQIRNGGQRAYSKSYNGTSPMGDHIPSVYLRAQYKRWFLQGEFRFGAPQLVDHFSYSRQTRYDTASSEVKVTSLQLKKLYYHQVPLSINYTILPNWSVGAGGIFSRFYRAVAEQEVESRNVFSNAQTTATSRLLVPGFRDSFLYKTQVQWLVQTDYRFGRLSLGLRYKRDVQPYIRYTKPDGAVVSRRGEALEAVLRFRLWAGKK